jgi:predicted DNA-binding ribbon-helix-helix protein
VEAHQTLLARCLHPTVPSLSIGRWLIRRGQAVKSLVLKRSVVIAGRKTSVCVEEEFWNSVKEIAGERNITVMQLVREIDANREHDNLSSAIRLFVIGVYRDRIDFAKAGTAEPEVLQDRS